MGIAWRDSTRIIPMRMLPREYLPDDYNGPCAGTKAELAGM